MPAPYRLDGSRRPYVLTADLAEALGVSAKTIRARARRGALPASSGRAHGHGNALGWDLRRVVECLRRRGERIPAAWIAALTSPASCGT